MTNVIETNKLTRKFNGFTAVDSINLQIRKGELFGLLGPNGAGKTTTLSMLSTIRRPTSGTARVNGFDVNTQQDEVRNSIGIVFQDPSLDDELTAYENLDFHAMLYGMPAGQRMERIKEVLELVELSEKRNEQVKRFSGGMKRRLEIARGLIHHPKVLFLDEPTLGLDPQTRRNIWDHIREMNKSEDVTVVITTHYMEEADSLCDRVAVIDQGKIIALDSPDKLKHSLGGDIISLEADAGLLPHLKKIKNIKKIKRMNGEMSISAQDAEHVIPAIFEIAQKNKIEIHSISLRHPTLEDVFLQITGKSIRDEKAGAMDMFRTRIRSRNR
ncbi:MAG: ATP-binding cassette domain-containing protein [Candidatus Micrarchaeota archaeon]|nr:ATP-binding cassette domain-containing protein [Candidatus Micrarchaeota archaeon]